MAASEMTTIKWDPDELADVDRVRGKEKRGTWIKACCKMAVAAHDSFNTTFAPEPKQRTQPLTPEIAAFELDKDFEKSTRDRDFNAWGGVGKRPPNPKRSKR